MLTSLTARKGLTLLVIIVVGFAATSALAFPSRWTSRCASCHTNDTPSCDGCHFHRGSINAVADQQIYTPGSLVTITLTGGDEHGWVRGLLYDQSQAEIDRATGPTGTGDDGLANSITFPITLSAPAPLQAGTYVWQAAWYGGATTGASHVTQADNVTIVVEGTVGVPDTYNPVITTWSEIKSLFR